MTITASIIGSSFLTVMMNGETRTVNSDHVNYVGIREALKLKDHDTVERLINVKNSVINFARGKVVIKNEQVFYGEMEVKGVVVNRILAMVRENFDAQSMLRFLENLMDNPSKTAVDELYLFLEAASLPITEDGCFLSYKKVNSNYKDFYSDKFDNSIGKTCSVIRNTVNEDRNQTCSFGLHFCSLSYLPHYHGGQGRVMIVKINPRDVVAIPSDYDNAKGRCCEYVVVGEHTSETEHAFTSPVYTTDAKPSTPMPSVAPKTVAPVKLTVVSNGSNSGLLGYNTGRSDAANNRSYNATGNGSNGSGYIDAYLKGWNSVFYPPVKVSSSDKDYESGYEDGTAAANRDNCAKQPYNNMVPDDGQSDDYMTGFDTGYDNHYDVDWESEGYAQGEIDAKDGSLYNDDDPTFGLDDERLSEYKASYADGWRDEKVSKL